MCCAQKTSMHDGVSLHVQDRMREDVAGSGSGGSGPRLETHGDVVQGSMEPRLGSHIGILGALKVLDESGK